MSWKRLFSRSLSAAPERLHFAAHSHHLWPDASYDGQLEAWQDAAGLADHKWSKIMGPVWEEAQGFIAAELNLPDPSTLAFAPNTHDFLIRIMSAIETRPVRILSTDGEFHSFRRQVTRWVEAGEVDLQTVPADQIVRQAQSGEYDLVFASHVLFNSGDILSEIEKLAAIAKPEGPWVVIDGYHGFMAIETDISKVADRVFYLSGGYKYAMAGEGVCFLHAPPGFALRPAVTGWYAAFDDLALPPDEIGYAPDGRRFLGSTFDPSGLYRFNAVQRMLAQEGLSTNVVSEHVANLQEQFLEANPFANMEIVNPVSETPHARFLAFKSNSAPALHAALESRDVVTDVRGDVLRIGFAIYHDKDDVDHLIKIIRQIQS